jgi:aspartokinase/homoserine dehydrogenase 1
MELDSFLDETKYINVFLIGTNDLAAELLKQINTNKSFLKKHHGVAIRVLAILNTEKMILDERGISLNKWQDRLAKSTHQAGLEDFLRFAERFQMTHDKAFTDGVVVDCTSSTDVSDFYFDVLEAELNLVTANKKAMSDDMDHVNDLLEMRREHESFFLYETNVGGSLPIISTMKDLVMSGDKIISIEGALSGSMNYILNNLNSRKKFSSLVKEAIALGYMEEDPADDLSGLDLARKILIMARLNGSQDELQNVSIKGLLDYTKTDKLEMSNSDDFFSIFDQPIKEIWQKAKAKKKKLCYLAKYQNSKCQVSLEEIDQNSPFYHLQDMENMVVFHTERYSSNPLIIRGPGSGNIHRAAGLLADILRLIR